MSDPATPAPNCPFYGRHIGLTLLRANRPPVPTVLFLDSGGNQCALRMDSYTPCDLVLERKPVNWRECPAWADVALPWQEKR